MRRTDPQPRPARRLRRGAALAATSALATAGLLAALAPADAATARPALQASSGYAFTTLDNAGDPTFNQLLGINNLGVIAGYLGSGAQGHPNRGYLLNPPHAAADYTAENFPGSVQTQVTGLNDLGTSVGFWSSQNTASGADNNFGFYASGGKFHQVDFPVASPASPPVDQLLGVNDRGTAVGFYTNAQGLNRGYEYNISSRGFSRVLLPGLPNLSAKMTLTATAINNLGGVAGYYSLSGGPTIGFLKSGGRVTKLAVPGAAMTQPFGVNDLGEVAGTYTVGSGSSAMTHGFTWTAGQGFRTVDDPQGVGTTFVNGLNDRGDLVGFYTDAAGNTDGMLATP